jgi:hypothetical protein
LVVEDYLLRKREYCAIGIGYRSAAIPTRTWLVRTWYERPTHPVLHGHGISERQLGPALMRLKFILKQVADIRRKFFNVSLTQSVPLFSSAAKIPST